LSALLAAGLGSGCMAITNPTANGIPVRRLPPEVLGSSRELLRTIPLTALRQEPPSIYRLATGDTLGVYIEGVLPANVPNQPAAIPPVFFPAQTSTLARALPPAMGFPIPVRERGMVDLPLVGNVMVGGMSLSEAEDTIRKAYIAKEILQAGRDRIVVTLMQPRATRVLVMRQEVGGFTFTGGTYVASGLTKRGSGHVIDLRAYENDVLSALAQTGGLPGLDDYNQVIIFKGGPFNPAELQKLPATVAYYNPMSQAGAYRQVVTIPLRMKPGEPLAFRPEDVILSPGDVVFLEARVMEVYYTGGLLPPAERILPRDYDLDVVEAIAQAQGPLINGAYGGSNLSGTIINPRPIGNENPSLLSVIRRTPDGNQIVIRVDLNRALRDARERIVVQPSDVLILQETPGEAFGRYVSQVFSLNLSSKILNTSTSTGTSALAVP
jgi:protein involved in polysaccharide export with SLBB domain